jgi:hypothetical protein
MRLTFPLATTLLLAASAGSGASAAVLDVPVTPLIVRIYDVQTPPSPDGQSALDEARTILADAGLAAEWVRCASLSAHASRCAVPLDDAELAVRVVTAPPQPYSTRPLPLGYSLVDGRTRSGSLATIYLDRVQWLASASTTDAAALLGRAIAHEIGHLLLGTAHHGRFGVMRATWSRQMVRTSRPNEWRFSLQEARRMRAALASRRTAPLVASR